MNRKKMIAVFICIAMLATCKGEKERYVIDGAVPGGTKAVKITLEHLYAEFMLEERTIEVDLSESYRVKGMPLYDEPYEFLQEKEMLVLKAGFRMRKRFLSTCTASWEYLILC